MTTPTLAQQVVESIRISGEALEKAAAEETRFERQREKVAGLIPSVVDALVTHGRIRDTERAVVQEKLASHEDTLALLRGLAGHKNEVELERLGTSRDKSAAAGPAYAAEKTAKLKESDRVLWSALGLAVPSA